MIILRYILFFHGALVHCVFLALRGNLFKTLFASQDKETLPKNGL